MLKSFSWLVALLLLLLSGTALADPQSGWKEHPHGGFGPHHSHPHDASPRPGWQGQRDERIRQGVHSGELTRPEAARLWHQERQIDRYRRMAREDGHVAPREALRLERMRARQNRAIYQQKHDEQLRD